MAKRDPSNSQLTFAQMKIELLKATSELENKIADANRTLVSVRASLAQIQRLAPEFHPVGSIRNPVVLGELSPPPSLRLQGEAV